VFLNVTRFMSNTKQHRYRYLNHIEHSHNVLYYYYEIIVSNFRLVDKFDTFAKIQEKVLEKLADFYL